jgi:hypothetical protein
VGNSTNVPERERYQRILAALAELAQVALTLKGLATLDPSNPSNLRDLVVENIAALVDDMQQASGTSQWVGLNRSFAARRLQRRVAALSPQDAIQYRVYDDAILRAEVAFRTLTMVRSDTLAAQVRSQLDHTIRSVKDAFRQLAATPGPADPALLDAIGSMRAAIADLTSTLASLGPERTFRMRDGAIDSVIPVDSLPRWRSAGEAAREALHRPARDDLRGGMSPFDRFD